MRQQRNVLFIVVDQWRGDTLGVLDHPCIRTPHLDALCADGVTFRRHYTQAAPCGPGRASLLTGLYMMNHRVVQNSVPMDSRHTNLALEMRKHSYEPALVGYTTTTPDPRETSPRDPRFRILGSLMQGWFAVGNWEPEKIPYFNWLRSKGYAVPAVPEDIWLPQENSYTGATTSASRIPQELSDTSWSTECALSYLSGMHERSWFLHLGYYRPHPPFIAPAPYNTCYDPAEVPAPQRAASPELEGQQHPLLQYYLQSVKQSQFFQDGEGLGSAMSEAAVRRLRTAYYGMISEVDAHVGRVLGYLKDTGQYDNTLIVFTCDHGEQLGDHYLLGKIGYFDASFQIPLIIRDPSAAAAGSRGRIVEQFTETIDVMPTVLSWVGAEVPRACDGRSLLPFLHGETPSDWRTEVHYEFDFRTSFRGIHNNVFGLHVDQCGLAVVQDTRYKYVHFDALPPLFFDLQADPGQFRNLAHDPAYAPRVLEYAQKMLTWRLHYADRTLTGYSSSPEGLVDRHRGVATLVASA
ncbi:MAG: alkaline phosphatase family protein [Candidatus Tectomicrobia bacterium]|uniref:Alkaline phosphatase family protein n=1 Tax=Tectimicrobiota bacterium TaxID=2528274 RepID=A0A937VWC4_UNCTE|nr:alkaline phosphatase family protein [Candidatus Tectomicrobia bacterium]